MQNKKMAFKKRLDVELRKFSEEDIKKSKTFKTSKEVRLPWQGAYDEVSGDWYLDKFTALMYLKYKYNSFKKGKPSGNDEEWFDAACKDFLNANEESYHENKKTGTEPFNSGIFKDSNKDEAVTNAEMIIFINDYLEEIVGECGETDIGVKYQSFCSKEGSELPQLKVSYKNYLRNVGNKSWDELNGLSSGAEKIAEFAGGAIGIGVVAAIVIGLIAIVMNLGDSSSSSSSGSSARSGSSNCESKLRSCVASKPESQWNSCQSSYSICLSNSR